MSSIRRNEVTGGSRATEGRLASACRVALLAILAPLAACGPRSVEVEGLQELTKEVRSQRLAMARSRAQSPAGNAGEQIQGALSPLRDALTQLTDNQRELAARQITLTQEMRRWTQLLAESMQAKERAGADAMAQRLAKLEQTLAAQDARHREVEQMLAAALDRTAEQLEDFLRRVGADVPPIEAQPKPAQPKPAQPEVPTATPDGGSDPGKAAQPEASEVAAAPGSGGGFVPAVGPAIAPAGAPAGTAGGARRAAEATASGNDVRAPTAAAPGEMPPAIDRSHRASTRWLWWLATFLSVAAGAGLAISSLVRRMTRRPARLAAPADAAAERIAKPLANHGGALVEPIDAEQGTVAAIAPLPLPLSKAELPKTELPEAELPEGDTAPSMAWPSAPHPASQPGDVLAPFADVLADLSNATDPADPRLPEADELWATAALLGEAIGKLKDAQPEESEALAGEAESLPDSPPEAVPEVAPEPAHSDEFELDEIFILDDEEQAEPADDALVQCRLFVRADLEGAARIRRVLGSDPRVLAHPAPQVSRAGSEAEISFAVLPGLPAGERSVLEQKLRDTVA